ncbi:MAG: AI-2E family transporter [Pirellulales bacterium]|nr:AI-2E family transporter [Pirellulales bacterium]
MSRRASLLIVAGTVVVIGILFFRVIWPLIAPLFFAGLLAILFWPAYEWVVRLFRGRRRWAAIATTAGIVCVIVLPAAGLLTVAGMQLFTAGEQAIKAIQESQNGRSTDDIALHPAIAEVNDFLRENLDDKQFEQARTIAAESLASATKTVYERTVDLAGGLLAFAIGLGVMLVALYYAFADGHKLMESVCGLSPLDDVEEKELFNQFDRVCRGVVLGTVVSALVQGILAGIGFAIVGVEWVWLLIVLTMFFAMIPFLGAASVWITVAVFLAFEESWWSALFIVAYGGGIISLSDNVVRTYILHNKANMHPLIAFVTVIGALQVIGLWGIFVGPLTAAFFFALLKTLQNRLLQPEGKIEHSTVGEPAR